MEIEYAVIHKACAKRGKPGTKEWIYDSSCIESRRGPSIFTKQIGGRGADLGAADPQI